MGILMTAGAVLLFLLPAMVWDLRSRRIPFAWMVLHIGLAMLAALAGGRGPWFLLGVLPGLCLGICAWVTRGGMGGGDVGAVLVCGLYTSWDMVVTAVFWGLLGCAFWGSIQGIRRGRWKGLRLPFLPFLTGGMLLALGGELLW